MTSKYILDTNVISEFTKPKPNPKILSFLEKERDNYCICAPVYQELLFGIELLVPSKKKNMFLEFIRDVVDSLDVLSYDLESAKIHAKLRAQLQNKGKALPYVDSEIAAICIRNHSTLVTQNPKDYKAIPDLKLKVF